MSAGEDEDEAGGHGRGTVAALLAAGKPSGALLEYSPFWRSSNTSVFELTMSSRLNSKEESGVDGRQERVGRGLIPSKGSGSSAMRAKSRAARWAGAAAHSTADGSDGSSRSCARGMRFR